MSRIAEQMQQDLKEAMRARDQVRVAALRMAIAAVKEAAVAGKAAKELTDADVEQVLRTQVKRRDEAAEAFQAAGRDEQAQRELDERSVLSAYLPEELGDDELEAMVDEALAKGGFTEPSQMGPAMNAVMAAVAGRAEGKRVSAMVKAKLAS
ncbi:MAG TPA: GatB/YqeY domain-containing protein [Acidimicrobiales bacterium]|nr:GatB/YqeY domain-containing protein [Acidimicrobiales bacterium]